MKMEIRDANEMEDYMSEALTRFLQDFPNHTGLTRPVREDDGVSEEIVFIYTTRAVQLIDRFKKRMLHIANHYFPNEIWDFTSPLIIEE